MSSILLFFIIFFFNKIDINKSYNIWTLFIDTKKVFFLNQILFLLSMKMTAWHVLFIKTRYRILNSIDLRSKNVIPKKLLSCKVRSHSDCFVVVGFNFTFSFYTPKYRIYLKWSSSRIVPESLFLIVNESGCTGNSDIRV